MNNTKAVYRLHVICKCNSCVATILSDVNCTSEWFRLKQVRSIHDKPYRNASTLVECQAACEFDPRCVAVDWRSSKQQCDLNTEPNHSHVGNIYWDHYDFISCCSITQGQCFDSNAFASLDIVKTNSKTNNNKLLLTLL